jgi:glycosyltransferase involved in cell wall biosynthesis
MSVLITTLAYNAEKTIQRTIESVLNQTRSDFIYRITNNGSTDNTARIIHEYAKMDSRIEIYTRENNYIKVREEDMLIHMKTPDDWYCATLDSDDELALNFIEKMLPFAKENNLDIAACCIDHIEAETYNNLNTFILKNNIIVDEIDFDVKFPDYFKYMCSLNGKLLSCKLTNHQIDLKEIEKQCKNITYGTDTVMSFEGLKYAKKIGVLAEPLYKYYLYKNSLSTNNYEDRFVAVRFLVDVWREYLNHKIGFVSMENENHIGGVYLRLINKFSLSIINSAVHTEEEKQSLIFGALKHELTQEILKRENSPVKDKNDLAREIFKWIEKQQISDENEGETISILRRFL